MPEKSKQGVEDKWLSRLTFNQDITGPIPVSPSMKVIIQYDVESEEDLTPKDVFKLLFKDSSLAAHLIIDGGNKNIRLVPTNWNVEYYTR